MRPRLLAVAVGLAVVALLVGVVAWGQDPATPVDGVMHPPMTSGGAGAMGMVAGAGAAMLALWTVGRSVAMWAHSAGVLPGFLSWVAGQRAEAVDTEKRLVELHDTLRRVRLVVGVSVAPDEPAPGSGLVVDMAQVQTSLAGIVQQLDEIRQQLDEATQLDHGVSAALRRLEARLDQDDKQHGGSAR